MRLGEMNLRVLTHYSSDPTNLLVHFLRTYVIYDLVVIFLQLYWDGCRGNSCILMRGGSTVVDLQNCCMIFLTLYKHLTEHPSTFVDVLFTSAFSTRLLEH